MNGHHGASAIAACAVCLELAASAGAAETAAFLKLAPGARPIGLGEAFTAVADDLNAQSLNPAGLSQLVNRELYLSHAELAAGTVFDGLSYGQPLSRDRGTLAAGVTRLSHGAIAGRDAQGRPSGDYTAADMAVQLAYGATLPGVGMLGVNAKYLESKLAYASARGMAFDVGLLRRSRGPWAFGAAARNLGNGLRFADRTDELPLTVAVGATARLAGALMVSAELSHRARSGGVAAGVGSEYSLLPSLVVRGGYRSGLRETGPSASGFAAGGLGMGFGIRMRKATFDYSFTPQGSLGQSQRVSVSTRF
ncbi:MAG: PorV/PorQ family protein [Elusimicrobia bacterium]|nr:PorV/PorQ family protein [Elusimicrobiota bacterium]